MKEIPLSNSSLLAMVDDADFDLFSRWKWKLSGRGYVSRSKKIGGGRCTTVYLHKEIMGATAGQIVDHRDRNHLNCSRENLRVATKSQNAMNARAPNRRRKSRFKGVFWVKKARLWYVKTARKCFSDEIEAARAYDSAIVGERGEFAVTNAQLGLL